MKRRNVWAVLLQDFYLTKGSMEVIFDVFIFTSLNIILFGFISKYLSHGSENNFESQSLLIAVIFWEVIRITQYSASVSSMWNVWSHNLSNMFIAPIRVAEYLLAHIITAVLKSLFILVNSCIIARYLFGINILKLGLFPILFSYVNMVIFATAIGLVLIGLVFQYGTRIQVLTWATIYVIEPLCAVFFPVNVLPGFIQPLAYLFPVTYFFEWLRAIQGGVGYSVSKIVIACMFNLIYLICGGVIFSRQLAAAKRSGQIVRNDL